MKRSRRALFPLLLLSLGCAGLRPTPAGPELAAPQPLRDPDARIDQAMDLRAQDRRDEALALLKRVRVEALARGDAESAALALHREADVLHDLGKDDDARPRYELAYKEYLRNHQPLLAARAANDLGLAEDNPDQQAYWYGQSTELRLALSDLRGLRIAANNLGTALFYLEDWEGAVQAYGEALDAARSLGDAAGECRVESNLALLWAVRAEGGFPGEDGSGRDVEDEPPPVDPANPAEVQARAHFRAALRAASRAGEDPSAVCEAFGRYGNRCARLSPKPADGK